MVRPLILSVAAILAATALQAEGLWAEGWRATPLSPADWPREIVAEARAPAPEGLPDGLMAARPGGDIIAAWYVDPTDRYRHGALGDVIEAGGLRVRLPDGAVLTYRLPTEDVFEDRHPRLADLDGDGAVEVITIRANARGGAAVTVYGLGAAGLEQKATTPFIGRANRWLNIAAIAPFTGGPGREIAYVETPHIGGTLFVWRYQAGEMTLLGREFGYSNHENGARELRLSATGDLDGDGRPELALPADNRRALKLVKIDANGPRAVAEIPLPARIDKAIAWDEGGFILGLDDGSVVKAAPE